jgi:VCBS repeat protein/FG-GAP repeat protein
MSTWPPGIRLGVERLEEREVPAITILVDYSLDARVHGGSGFFQDHPDAKAVMDRVASEMGQRVSANMTAIVPSSSNTWSALFYDPRTGGQFAVANLRIAANTIIVYAGARAMPGNQAAVGGYGGYSYSGGPAWGNTIARRGWSGFSLWGGSLSFDTTVNWHLGLTTSGLDANELDFYSVATHELGHILGIGTAPQWHGKVSGAYFNGSYATGVYGAPVPLNADRSHWADTVTINGQPVSLDPVLNYGARVTWSVLDQSALRDIGWAAGATVSPPTMPPSPPPPSPPVTLPPVGGESRLPVLVSGANDGRVHVYARGGDGNLAYTGKSFTPFAGYTRTIHTAVADFDGDRIADYAFSTGAGTGARVRIISGATGSDLLGPTQVLGGFGGGAFVAAGDLDRDGRAELAVSADRGGLPAVEVYRLASGELVPIASFLPILEWSRSGVRVAMGDLNRDGADELVVSAGSGWAPRVRIFDGASLAVSEIVQVAPSFLAYAPMMRYGVNVAVGDVNGDGFDEVIVSLDTGGHSKVRVWSGATIASNPDMPANKLGTYQQFFANGLSSRDGIRVAARDIDGDGKAELITSGAGDNLSWLRVLSVSDLEVSALAALLPYGSAAALGGVYVG